MPIGLFVSHWLILVYLFKFSCMFLRIGWSYCYSVIALQNYYYQYQYFNLCAALEFVSYFATWQSGTINSHSNESSWIWLDHSKSLPLSQFLCEWRSVSFFSLLLIIFWTSWWEVPLHMLFKWLFLYTPLCFDVLSLLFNCVFMFLAVRSLVFTFRRDVQKLHPEVKQQSILMFFVFTLL